MEGTSENILSETISASIVIPKTVEKDNTRKRRSFASRKSLCSDRIGKH